eukprot:m.466350 g.466350  ORF g.466350 m.466350 type:complete len:204 (+) comp25129_c0_seq1:83-694(+)
MPGAGSRATVVGRKVERLVGEGRAERALELLRDLLETLVGELSAPGLLEPEKLRLRELTATHMGRAEELKRMCAARPKGVGGAFQLLTSGLRHQLATIEGVPGVPDKARLESLDLAGLLSTCISNWPKLPWSAGPNGGLTRSLLHELRHWRNAWAHQRLVSSEDTFRAIDTAQRILIGCGAGDYATDCDRFFKGAALRAIAHD